MFGSELYAALVREEANDLATERQRRQLHRPAAAPSAKDIEQDAHLRQVEHENLRLKGCFAALVHVLMEKGIMDENDVREVIEDARKVGV
jgi:hypothetical protein